MVGGACDYDVMSKTSCQCEIHEFCQVCAPEAWKRNVVLRAERESFRRGQDKVIDKEVAKYQKRFTKIRGIIETVEQRCMAVDGPVTPTHEEITDDELRKIYKLAGGKVVNR